MNNPLTVTTKYDENAYKALAETSWQLFAVYRTRMFAYPTLAAMIVLVAYALLFKPDQFSVPIRVGMVFLLIFFIAAVPLSASAAKNKLLGQYIKDARKNSLMDKTLKFTFLGNRISAEIDGQTADVAYDQIIKFVQLDDYHYYLFFFPEGAYMIEESAVGDAATRKEFEEFVIKHCGLPVTRMKRARW